MTWDAVTTYLEAQSDPFEEDVAAIQQGYRDVKGACIVSLDQFEEHIRQKYAIPC